MKGRRRALSGCFILSAAVVFSGQACPPDANQMMPAPSPQQLPVAGQGVLVDGTTVSLDTGFTNGLYWKLDGNAGTSAGTNFLGTADDEALELHVNGARALRLEPTASYPNVIGGFSGNTVTNGVVAATISGGGLSDPDDPTSFNHVFDNHGTIGGGANNRVGLNDGDTDLQAGATIAGGANNVASGNGATIAGGFTNTADGVLSFVGGGTDNLAGGGGASVGGGVANEAGGFFAAIGGGNSNLAAADFATIAGGGPADFADPESVNRVFDKYGTIGGGGGNTAGIDDENDGQRFATVGGGEGNTAGGQHATVGGGNGNRASDGYCTVGGGDQNRAGFDFARSADGQPRGFTSFYATVSGGQFNVVDNSWATIGGGQSNTASGGSSTISGGRNNTADDGAATIGGGSDNFGGGELSTIGGGGNNIAAGSFSTIPGGRDNAANNSDSFAAGRRAKANHNGAFVWGDSTNADVTSFGTNTFTVRAAGGVRFYSSTDTEAPAPGVELPAGDSAWAAISDRNAKENFEPVDARRVLERLVTMPIETWNYKSQAPSIRHIGPMAQDFREAFGVGHDEKRISTVDADGVALAAIQGLHRIVQSQQHEIQSLRARLDSIERQRSDQQEASK